MLDIASSRLNDTQFVDRGQPFPVLCEQSAVSVVVAGKAGGVLSTITDPYMELAIWQRARPGPLAWLDKVKWEEIDDIRHDLDIGDMEAPLAIRLAEAGYPQGAEADALRDEIMDLANRFARTLGVDRLSVRLEVVETDACRKFHADMVKARLLCTLSGPATQWIDSRRPAEIHRMRPGEVAIFKGRLMNDALSILHRSPPLSTSGKSRLLLVIDPVREVGTQAILSGVAA